MIRDYFVLPKDRLGSVDVIVPVLHVLKARFREARLWFVFIEDRTYVQLTRDAFLDDTVRSLAHRIVRLRWGKGGHLGAVAGIIRFVPVLAAMLLSPRFTMLHARGIASRGMKMMARLCRLKGGRCIEYPKQHVPIFLRAASEPFDGEEGDGFLCFSAKDVPHLRETGRTLVYPVGYPRMLRSWLDHVAEVAPSYVRREVPGSLDDGVIAVFLGSMVEGVFGLDEQRDWIRVVTDVLRKAAPEAWILVKPHPTTAPEVITAIIDEIGDKRVLLTYLHPSLVAAQARFVVSRHSSTIVDGLAAGRQVIQYQVFTPLWMKVHPEKSIYPQLGARLAESREELERLVREVLDGSALAVDVVEQLGHVENLQIITG